jgi:hypothetical protein
MKILSSESFFNDLMDVYGFSGVIDSSLISGIRTSGLTKTITENTATKFLSVDFNINDTKRPNKVGRQSIENPFEKF